MAIAYSTIIREVANTFGQIKGATPADAETNYAATYSTTTTRGPNFPPSAVADAIFGAIMDIITAIAETPLHTERGDFATVTGSLANLAAIPRTVGGGQTVIGVPLWVKDASDNIACENVDLDRVRDFNRFSGTVYAGLLPYYYCINDGRIEHTRTNVIMNVVAWTRPSSATGNIPLADHHEWAVVNGAAMRLAAKEGTYRAVYDQCKAYWDAHLANIRGYAEPKAYGRMQAAPAVL